MTGLCLTDPKSLKLTYLFEILSNDANCLLHRKTSNSAMNNCVRVCVCARQFNRPVSGGVSK